MTMLTDTSLHTKPESFWAAVCVSESGDVVILGELFTFLLR